MMEAKLQQAANALPEPKADYLRVEEAFKKQQEYSPVYKRKRRRVVLMLCLCLLLVGCVAGPTVPEYHLYNGNLNLLFPGIAFDVLGDELGWDPEWKSANKEAESLGWNIPESLGGSPWCEVDKSNLTTKKSNWFMAMLFHHYTQYSVSYGYEMETEITREDGTPSTAHWTDADVQITFGSMENEVWRRQFGFDEQDVHVGSEKAIDNFSQEYEGYTLYVSTFHDGEDFFYGLISEYRQYVHWVDRDHNTVFCVYSRDDTPDFAIECAKELIDQM